MGSSVDIPIKVIHPPFDNIATMLLYEYHEHSSYKKKLGNSAIAIRRVDFNIEDYFLPYQTSEEASNLDTIYAYTQSGSCYAS